MKLQKKIALITGGTSGIGKAIAHCLAKEGAVVIVSGRDEEKGKRIEEEIPQSTFIKSDVTQEASVSILIDTVIAQYGKVDILINSAGMDVSHSDITKVSEETYATILDTNFKSIFLTTKYAIPHLLKTKGTIVNIASQYGFTPDTEVPLYCSAKAAVIMFTKSMAKTYGKDGVRINCVCPGGVDTPLLKQFFTNDSEMNDWYADPSVVPLKRVGQPEEIAKVVAFLVSSDASYVTGAAWIVDGGSSL